MAFQHLVEFASWPSATHNKAQLTSDSSEVRKFFFIQNWTRFQSFTGFQLKICNWQWPDSPFFEHLETLRAECRQSFTILSRKPTEKKRTRKKGKKSLKHHIQLAADVVHLKWIPSMEHEVVLLHHAQDVRLVLFLAPFCFSQSNCRSLSVVLIKLFRLLRYIKNS